ncbi:hypothetical protein [Phaeocystidibacter luteus]|uniref:Uncharacterized protein n=1 Tax=Phaeocystidibacter luteus TaxID=911197 RepID=A0A6N6RH33_9FLAO|nr:hypothetical protein [Phaeocystidibacter luteus]KAB2810062.1 hypothetical protein F8C67_07445 [Phaeocystidibacter luteus]
MASILSGIIVKHHSLRTDLAKYRSLFSWNIVFNIKESHLPAAPEWSAANQQPFTPLTFGTQFNLIPEVSRKRMSAEALAPVSFFMALQRRIYYD